MQLKKFRRQILSFLAERNYRGIWMQDDVSISNVKFINDYSPIADENFHR